MNLLSFLAPLQEAPSRDYLQARWFLDIDLHAMEELEYSRVCNGAKVVV